MYAWNCFKTCYKCISQYILFKKFWWSIIQTHHSTLQLRGFTSGLTHCQSQSVPYFHQQKVATLDEARRLPRDVRRTRGRRPKMIDCLLTSCEQSSRPSSKTSDRRQWEGRRRLPGVSSPYRQGISMFGRFNRQSGGLVYFSLVELVRRSMVWYILLWILAADCLRSGIF